MKINSYIWFFALLLLPLLGGCVNEQYPDGNENADMGGEVEFTIQAGLPGNVDTNPVTYATEAQEHRLSTVDVLVFKEGSSSETFLYATHASEIKNGTSASNKQFKVTLKKTGTGERHCVVLLANLRDEVDAVKGSFTTTTTKNDALQLITFSSSGSRWSISAFPLWGETSLSAVAAGTIFPTVQLLRAVARIDVGIDMALDDGEYVAQGSPLLKIKQMKLYNSNALGAAVPEGTNYSSALPTIPAGVTRNTAQTYGGASLVDGIIREIYTAEYDNRSQADRDGLMCLLVGGCYTPPGSMTPNESVVTWYRVDLQKLNTTTGVVEPMDVLRNYRYIINIHTINGVGEASEADALASAGMPPIGVDVIPWDESKLSGSVTGDYELTLSQTIFNFKAEDVRAGAALDNQVVIMTDYSGGWKVDKIVDETGTPITGSTAWLRTDITQGVMGASATMSLLLTENMGAARVGYVYVTAGRWTYKIVVKQKGII